MAEDKHTRECIICGDEVAHERWALGYKTCMPCGEKASKRVKHTVVNLHKSSLKIG